MKKMIKRILLSALILSRVSVYLRETGHENRDG